MPMMEWLFGRKKTPAEMLRESQRALKKAMRSVFVHLPAPGLDAQHKPLPVLAPSFSTLINGQ